PERVKSLVLRGIFLGHRAGLDYFYQGNARDYDDARPPEAQEFEQEGAYRAYLGDGTRGGQIPSSIYVELFGPDRGPAYHGKMRDAYAHSWDRFVRMIPRDQRGDMVKAYAGIFEQRRMNEGERERQLAAALAWTRWEGLTSYLL